MNILRSIKRNIPNTITCMNLLSGCIATIFAFQYNKEFGTLQGYQIAFIFMAAAVIFDFCDGLSARLLRAYSAMGKELDSLSDLISFGFAPAALVYNMMLLNGAGIWALGAFLITVFGALRLAKFNIDENQSTTFTGLPIPANAIFWVGYLSWVGDYGYPGTVLTLIFVVLLSYAMVSKVRMFSLKIKDFAWRNNVRRYALILGTVLFVAFQKIPGLAWAIAFYVILSITSRREK